MITDSFGRLFNAEGEIVGEGSCQVDHDKGSVTFRPIVDTPLLQRQHGNLRLELDEGPELEITDRIIRFRLNVPGNPPGAAYRLYFSSAQRLRPINGDGG